MIRLIAALFALVVAFTDTSSGSWGANGCAVAQGVSVRIQVPSKSGWHKHNDQFTYWYANGAVVGAYSHHTKVYYVWNGYAWVAMTYQVVPPPVIVVVPTSMNKAPSGQMAGCKCNGCECTPEDHCGCGGYCTVSCPACNASCETKPKPPERDAGCGTCSTSETTCSMRKRFQHRVRCRGRR